MALAPVRALVPGVIERMLVSEGIPVPRGAALGAAPSHRRCATDREADRAPRWSTADRLASLASARGDAAEERLQRVRADALRREMALLDEELALTDAPRAGRPA